MKKNMLKSGLILLSFFSVSLLATQAFASRTVWRGVERCSTTSSTVCNTTWEGVRCHKRYHTTCRQPVRVWRYGVFGVRRCFRCVRHFDKGYTNGGFFWRTRYRRGRRFYRHNRRFYRHNRRFYRHNRRINRRLRTRTRVRRNTRTRRYRNHTVTRSRTTRTTRRGNRVTRRTTTRTRVRNRNTGRTTRSSRTTRSNRRVSSRRGRRSRR